MHVRSPSYNRLPLCQGLERLVQGDKCVVRLRAYFTGLISFSVPSIIGAHVTLLVDRLIPMDMRTPGQYGTTKTLLLLLVYIFLLILVDLPLTVITYR